MLLEMPPFSDAAMRNQPGTREGNHSTGQVAECQTNASGKRRPAQPPDVQRPWASGLPLVGEDLGSGYAVGGGDDHQVIAADRRRELKRHRHGLTRVEDTRLDRVVDLH